MAEFLFLILMLYAVASQAQPGSSKDTPAFVIKHNDDKLLVHRADEDVLNDLRKSFSCDSGLSASDQCNIGSIETIIRISNINFSSRGLSGTIPSSLGNLTHLEDLDLSNNDLEGPLPDLSKLTPLRTLNLQNNKLNGSLPDWLVRLTNLKEIFIQNNDFSGEIPCQLFSKSNVVLNYSGNPLLSLPKQCHAKNSSCTGATMPFTGWRSLLLCTIILAAMSFRTKTVTCLKTILLRARNKILLAKNKTVDGSNIIQETMENSSVDIDAERLKPNQFVTTFAKKQIKSDQVQARHEIVCANEGTSHVTEAKNKITPRHGHQKKGNISVTEHEYDNTHRIFESISTNKNEFNESLANDEEEPTPNDLLGEHKKLFNSTEIEEETTHKNIIEKEGVHEAGSSTSLDKRSNDLSAEDCYLLRVTCGSKPKACTTDEIIKATQNFSEKIGEGGFGSVFMGNLEDGSQVAVKVLSAFSNQGKQEFLNELELLCHANHKQLVSLLGYNNETKDLMLIYEYMPGGSLKDRLYGPKSEGRELSWRERLSIVLDAAKGLEYLHVECKTKFIHRDVKTANILLDNNLRGKLSDFGLAKGTMNHEASHITTIVKGTPGYLDPQYFKTQMLTDKSDIYSFGVVLLEVMCGRKAVDSKLPQEEINLVKWAMPYLETKQTKAFVKIMDKKLMGRFANKKSIRRTAKIAMACVNEDPSRRPEATDVVHALKHAIQEENRAMRQTGSSYWCHPSRSSCSGGKEPNTYPRILKGSGLLKFRGREMFPSTMEPIAIMMAQVESYKSTLHSFTMEEINEATNNFSKLLGSGGFGSVYMGIMKDGYQIAVKVLSEISSQRREDLLSELESWSCVNHKNIVSLLGYCFSEQNKPMLIYEYMPGGSLANHLYGVSEGKELKLRERVQIALDVAEALEYLHGGCNTKLIHRDVRISNILLDNNLRGKLSDFGLSRLIADLDTHVRSTSGFVDPEYKMLGGLTESSDIYSFGVVLLEMICGREPMWHDMREERVFLPVWVMDNVDLEDPKTLMNVIDKRLIGSTFNVNSIARVTKLALACVDRNGAQRPSATHVVRQLTAAIEEEHNLTSPKLDETPLRCNSMEHYQHCRNIRKGCHGMQEDDDGYTGMIIQFP